MTRRLCPVLALAIALGCNKAPAAAPPSPSAPAAAGAPAQAAPAAKPVPAELPAIVARVNGEAIERVELDSAVRAATARSGGAVPPGQRDAVYRGVLDQLVAFRLIVQESKARNVTVGDADINAKVGDVRKQFPTEEALRQALASQGTSPERLPQDIRTKMLVAKVVEAEVAPKVSVTPQEIQAFYQRNPQHFKQPESVHASHILIRLPEGADDAAKKKARAEAEDVLKKLKSGSDFATLAKERSQDPGSAPRGGDLGLFRRGQMVPPFETAAFALKPGETSGLVESAFGFHIIKMAERKPERTIPLQEVSERIGQYLNQQQRAQKTQTFVEQLKAKGKVEIFI